MSDFGMNLDVVDKDGRVVGCLPSEEVHAQGLLHRSVHILLVNVRNELFVRKRSHALELYPGVWTSSVGAHVLHGEAVKHAGTRALGSFLGLEVSLKSLAAVHVRDEIENELMSVFSAHGNAVPRLNPEHSEEGHFLPLEEVLSLVQRGEATPHLSAAVGVYAR